MIHILKRLETQNFEYKHNSKKLFLEQRVLILNLTIKFGLRLRVILFYETF